MLRAYDERCAISGLRLSNGGGRAEVEAAHIRPVEHNGADSLSDELDVLTSSSRRQSCDD
jgi:putative restriction endonuclease